MIRPSSTRVLAVVAVAGWLTTGGCAQFSHRAPPTAESQWAGTLALAQSAAADGRFEVADSALAAFAETHPGTANALETRYWRAVFALDPSSQETSLAAAVASLDAYLDDPRPRGHVAEAITLRRIAGHMDELAKQATAARREAAANARIAAEQPKTFESPAADAEIKRLKDELAKANAELDRIRKRLAKPTKP